MEDTSQNSPGFPLWIDEKQVDDNLVADAYENAGPDARAAIKTAISLFINTEPVVREVLHEERRAPLSGFWRSRTSFPAPWAIVVFSPKYTAAARLLGAIMPAVAAGISTIAAVCVDGIPHQNLLATLDLAGITDILSLSITELCALLEETQPGPGRLVLLHSGELDGLRVQARTRSIPFYEERRPPIITIPRPELFNMDVLRFAHGDAPVERALNSPDPVAPDVLYATDEAVRSHCLADTHAQFSLGMAALALGPGCEAYWKHPGLGAEFFLASRIGFGLDCGTF